MSGYLLDTNAVLDTLAPLPPGRTWLIPPGALSHVSVVTVIELRFGVAKAPQDPARIARLTRVVETWEPLAVDSAVSTAFGFVATAALAAGQDPRRRMNDLLVAATALAHGLTLVTSDAALAAGVAGVVEVRGLYGGPAAGGS